MKLTKKSYNRRIYVFGTMMFLAVALISTGFATWVMSTGDNENGEGSIEVGTITEGSIQIDSVNFDNGNEFLFEPAKNDTTGDIKWDASAENPVSEKLSVTISGTISPKQYFKKLTIQMTELPEGVKAAAEAGYIVLPTCVDAPVDVTTTSNDGEDFVNYSYTILFDWGAEFGGENPSIYLDTENVFEEPGQDGGESTYRSYTYQEKLDILVKFRRTIYQLDSNMEAAEVMSYEPNPDQALKYKVELVAYSNV